jgi:GntR family transcriptional regulator, transcriptional repressor for pyruvate dehydrogenase complex
MIEEEERAALVEPRAAKLAHLLRLRMHAGILQPGERLQSGRDLAERLGVSRATLRTALRSLQNEGYLVTRPGAAGGVFVSDLKAPADRWFERMRADAAQLEDMLDYRLAVETRAAALAAQRRSDEDMLRLQDASEMLTRTNWRTTIRRANSFFHEAVAAASKSPRLQAASRAVRGEQWFPSTRLDIDDHVVHVMNSHRAIYLAIREQDAVGAAAAMGAEIESTRAILRTLMWVL